MTNLIILDRPQPGDAFSARPGRSRWSLRRKVAWLTVLGLTLGLAWMGQSSAKPASADDAAIFDNAAQRIRWC